MIKYRLTRAGMRPGYFFKAVRQQQVNTRELAQRAQEGTTLSPADFLASLMFLTGQVEQNLLKGQAVEIDGLGIFFVSLRGEAEHYEAQARPKGENLRISFQPAAGLVKRLRRQARFERIETKVKNPTLTAWRDVVSERNDVYTPGGIGELHGHYLSFLNLQDDPTEGVFFVDDRKGATRVSVYATATDGTLTFMIPATLAGLQQLEVRRRVDRTDIFLQVTAWPVTLNAA